LQQEHLELEDSMKINFLRLPPKLHHHSARWLRSAATAMPAGLVIQIAELELEGGQGREKMSPSTIYTHTACFSLQKGSGCQPKGPALS
jgi:hypothetical protein